MMLLAASCEVSSAFIFLAGGYKAADNSSSVISSGNGQLKWAVFARLIHSLIVLLLTPTLQAVK
jgi:hypothetical protein